MRFSPDFTGYKDTFGTLIPNGRYTSVIEDVAMEKSKAGNEMLIITMRVRGGDYDGATVIDRLTDTPKAHFRIVNFLEAITGKPVPRKKLNLETDSWLGRALQIDTSERTWTDNTGRERTSVQIDGYTKMAATSATASAKAEEDDLSDIDSTDEAQSDVADNEPNGTHVEEKAKKAETKKVDTEDVEEIDLDSIEL